MRIVLTIAAVFFLVSCQTTEQSATVASKATDSAKLNAFFETVFAERLARNPEQLTRLGERTRDGEWYDRSYSFAEQTLAFDKATLASTAERFDERAFSGQDELSLRLLKRELEQRIDEFQWHDHDYPIDHRSGIHTSVPAFLINNHSIRSLADAKTYIARLNAVGVLFDQVVAQLERSADKGVVAPALVFPQALEAAANVTRGAPFDASGTDSTIRADFRSKLAALDLPASEAERLLADADAALVTVVGPAYSRLVAALTANQQLADGDNGVWSLPDGDAYYAAMLRRYTTTTLTADELHQIGLDEVARIHAQMRAIMAAVEFDGSLPAFFEFTRTDAQFYYPNTAAGRQRYLEEATAIIDAMRLRLDELFIRKPEASMVVRRVEPFREKSAGKAFYSRPAADGTRPGVYYANLYRMDRMPTYQMRALAYHEGIPGHHMQIAIQQELGELPRFRRFGRVTAFSEGWGLYSEWLPTEIAAYPDPYSDFGRLAMELWRACRLVVDTGMHAKRWSRQQAIDYLLETTPNPEGDVINAIDRYLVYPGQATAYKVGMIRIMQLRAEAERALGDGFDVRRFHDAVLANGPIPMTVLDEEIRRFIAAERQRLARNPS
ncbi:MAG: DUF885 domain-containing protein [Pseudomonadota bacterium]